MHRILALAAAIAVFATPALSAYYIAQSSLDKSCSVIARAPDGKKQLKVGERTFDNEKDALQGMMIAPECKP